MSPKVSTRAPLRPDAALRSDFHAEVARLLRELPTIAIDASDRELDRHLRDRIRPPPRAGTDTPERRYERPERCGPTAPPELQRAEALLDQDDLRHAIALLLAYVDEHPHDVPAHALLRYAAVRRQGFARSGPLRLAYCRMRLARSAARGDSSAVLYWCERVLVGDPADVVTMVTESAHALRLGLMRTAAWIARDALEVDPHHRGALRAAIAAERDRGSYGEAIALTRRLAKLEPDDPRIPAAIAALEALWVVKSPPPDDRPHERIEYISFDRVLKELQMGEDELRRLVLEGEIRAFRDEGTMKFEKSDIEGRKSGRVTEPPPGGGGEAEILLDIDSLDLGEASSTSVPTVDFSVDETGSETLTEKLVFDDDSPAAFETEELRDRKALSDDEWAAGMTTEPIQLVDAKSDELETVAAPPPPPRRAPARSALRGAGAARPPDAKRKRAAPDAKQQRATMPKGVARAIAGPDEALADKARPAAPAQPETAKKTPAPVTALPDRTPVRFERWIADDAGRPGPVERVLAQSKLLLRALRTFVGLRLVAIAALFDVVVDTATSYARGIQSAWLAWRTLSRRLARRGREAAALATDLAQARGQLWRLLRFRGELPPAELARRAPAAFDLELVLATRAHLDQMSRDLALLTPRSAGAAAGKSIVGVVVSLIPNPFELASALKDWVVLTFALRYDRRAVEAAYADLLAGTRQLVRLAQRASPAPDHALMELHPAEALLLRDHGLPIEPHDSGAIEPWIAQVESRLQRLIAALFAPQRAMDPRCWSRADLVRELRHAAGRGVDVHAPLDSECERWIVGLVQRRWREHGDRPSAIERALRQAEHRERRARWRAARDALWRLA